MADTAANHFTGVEVIAPDGDRSQDEVVQDAMARAKQLASMPKSWHDEVEAKLEASRNSAQ